MVDNTFKQMSSVVSYPDRGPYGKSNWRGNTSGHILVDLFRHYQPKTVVDICEGSGTTRDVCKEMGIEYFGFDLINGVDFTKVDISSLIGKDVDLAFSHLPYFNMINYQDQRVKNGYKAMKDANDLSMTDDLERFLEMSYQALVQQRESIKESGVYATLIGDYRKNGNFYSFQSDFIKMMPKNELKGVVIKQQHNTVSGNTMYASSSFIPINHEYLLVWKKTAINIYQMALNKACELKKNANVIWRVAIRQVMMKFQGAVSLDEIYKEVAKLVPEKVSGNVNWQAKVRQELQNHYVNVKRGVWAVA